MIAGKTSEISVRMPGTAGRMFRISGKMSGMPPIIRRPEPRHIAGINWKTSRIREKISATGARMLGIAERMFGIHVRIFAIEKKIWEIGPKRVKTAASGITARVLELAGGKVVSIERMPQCIGRINPRMPEAASIEVAALRRVPVEVAMKAAMEVVAATGADSLDKVKNREAVI